MPKKKKAKKKKAKKKNKKEEANNLQKHELSELRDSLQVMQQEADMTEIEADNTLKELDVLKYICDEKEKSLTRQVDIHEAEVVSALEEADAQYHKDRFMIKELTEDGKVLESQAQAAREVELENQRLRERIAVLTKIIAGQAKQHGDIINGLNYDKFVVRDRLESTYRTALRDAYAKQRSHAYHSLDTLSRKALDLNAQLKQEMGLRERGLERLHKEMESNHAQIAGIQHQNKSMSIMGKQQMRSLALLQRATAQYKLQKAAYEDELKKKDDTKQDIKLMIEAAKQEQADLLALQNRKQKRILQLRNRQRALQRRLGPRAKKGPVVRAAKKIIENVTRSPDPDASEGEDKGSPVVAPEQKPDTKENNGYTSASLLVSTAPGSVSSRTTTTSTFDFASRFFVP